jgi:hypothetical protein
MGLGCVWGSCQSREDNDYSRQHCNDVNPTITTSYHNEAETL